MLKISRYLSLNQIGTRSKFKEAFSTTFANLKSLSSVQPVLNDLWPHGSPSAGMHSDTSTTLISQGTGLELLHGSIHDAWANENEESSLPSAQIEGLKENSGVNSIADIHFDLYDPSGQDTSPQIWMLQGNASEKHCLPIVQATVSCGNCGHLVPHATPRYSATHLSALY
jgi:hypothetical protein